MLLYVFFAFLAAFVITALIGPPVILALRRLKCGQVILDIGPNWHRSKGNVPTMGGLMFILASIVSCVAVMLVLPHAFRPAREGDFWSSALVTMCMALVFAFIGFLDDYVKVKKKRNMGLTAKQKFLAQCIVSAAYILVMHALGHVTSDVVVPFSHIVWHWPLWVYVPFMMFVIVGTVNAVNLTDGIDGLAAGVTLIVMIFFTFASIAFSRDYLPAAGSSLLAAAVAGGLAGFLLFNFNPAKVFMGDTGALFLGAIVCGLAFAIDMPLILIPAGVIYIIETLSDIIQIGYYKLSHGKRIFKMAPIHHHFELCGWSERKIDYVAYSITLVFCALAYWGVLLTF